MIKNLAGNECRRCKRCGLDPWVGKIPWKRKWQRTPVSFPGKSHGHRSLVGCNPWGRKESGTTERLTLTLSSYKGFPGDLDGKESTCKARDPGSIPGSGRSAGEGNGTPLQYPFLENLMDKGAWWAAVHGVAKSWARLSN